MADSAVDVANPTGNADVRTEATNGNFRQVVVIGDPATNAGVATVTDGAPAASDYALVVAIHPDSVNTNDQKTMSGSAPVVIASDQTTLPVETSIQYIDVTLSIDTVAYGASDLLADAQIVAACTRANDVEAILQTLVLIDEDDEKSPMTIYFTNVSTSWGTENSAPTITDAVAGSILGYVDIATADYKDLGGVSVVMKANLGIVVKPVSGSDDIYVAVVNGSGTQTYTAATDLKLRMGFI